MDLDDLVRLIEETAASARRPIVVGISGFGGAGKSTLARALVARIDGAVRMRGDDFLDPARSHRRSPDWEGVERSRLVTEVLVPFRERRPGALFRRYDWTARRLGDLEPVPVGHILVVDLIGLFHPDALSALDITVWCDLSLAIAQERGMKRDAALGRDHADLWSDVWVPNDRDFADRYEPRERADVRYVGAGAEPAS
ncbi:phosphoglycerate transporter [Microbacterium sp. M3]|uniref:Phosphoglycerate transporter n=1 Tax=Microbacterium arthrosphaerae TaxID=792652 RepID=A0ABU4H497_9MICO|nr:MULTISPECIES: phosphoglycerate transporter [Microbacterium]MDW4574150.1 phosphoglycerate transporter [Microbacterium arthrosphaerae]MDW7608005.1 phosphoglycerate transporter [Microbacterium sp. M3]